MHYFLIAITVFSIMKGVKLQYKENSLAYDSFEGVAPDYCGEMANIISCGPGGTQMYSYNARTPSVGSAYTCVNKNVKNLFTTSKQCRDTCWNYHVPRFCLLDKDEGNEFTASSEWSEIWTAPLPEDIQSTRYFFNRNTRKCEDFNYTGIGGNANNFITYDDCKSHCDLIIFEAP